MRPAGIYKTHDLLTYISRSTDLGLGPDHQCKVKVFVQGRISRPINGSKLIFHMRMYLYETSKSMSFWPIFHGLLTSDFGRFSMVNILIIGRFLSSTDGSKLIYLCETSSVCFHAKFSCSGVGLEVNII